MFNLIVIPLLVAGDRPEQRGDSPAAAGPGSVQVLVNTELSLVDRLQY